MVPMSSLWLPIIVSAVVVFLASWIVHMFLPFHRSDFARLPDEDAVLDALRALIIKSGSYLAPWVSTPAQMKEPSYIEKRTRGPSLFLTIIAGPAPGMGKPLAQWFVYLLVIALFVACLAHTTVAPGAPPAVVFYVTGIAAFMAYALGHPHQSIWYRQPWRTTVSYLFDGLIYTLLTAAVFAWAWPR